MKTYGSHQSMSANMSPEDKEKVMHAEFRSGDLHFYASDVVNMSANSCCSADDDLSRTTSCYSEKQPCSTHGFIDLSVGEFRLEEEQAEVFDRLSNGGAVEMPLQDTFWGSRFGIVLDKYGIRWLLDCDKRGVF